MVNPRFLRSTRHVGCVSRCLCCGRKVATRNTFASFHKLPAAWIVVDAATERIVDGGVHFAELIKTTRAVFIGRPISDFSPPVSNEGWRRKTFDRELVGIEGRHEDVVLQASDGTVILVDVHVSPRIREHRADMAVCLITDVTERKRLQSELIQKHKELRKAFLDVAQKSDDLMRLNGEIGELSAILARTSSLAAIGELTAELAHQLNNPLAAAISTTRRLDALLRKHDVPEYEPIITLLKDSHTRLQDTMADLKQVYRNSRASNNAPVAIDLRGQLESAMMLLSQRISNVEMRLDIEADLPCIFGRPSEIQHVLVNLIDNALQAVNPAGIIEIVVRREGKRVHLWVADSGPGIPLEQRERVFEPFFTTREQGSGLGLSVVRRHVENNKATIRVGESALGGAEFEIGFLADTTSG